MRPLFLSLALLASLPLCSQDQAGRWHVDVHSYRGTLDGHYYGTQNDQPFIVDLKNDLGLAADKTHLGFGLEYQGHRFGLELSKDAQDFAGSNRLVRNIVINGQNFNVGAQVNSTIKSSTVGVNWTIRALSLDHFWLGIDLGVRIMTLDINATGYEAFTATSGVAAYKATDPVPAPGVSAGFNAFDQRLVARAFYHFPRYNGATFTRAGADVRFFPISWVGVRAFTQTEELKVPKGAVNSEADIALDQSGSGVGVVFRF